jgi:hypoxanthine phosphoribosyltransferase
MFMPNIQIKDKEFALSIPEEEILKAVKEVGLAINRDLEGTNPLFICVLNGAFMFAGDLMKTINIPCEITFIKLSSYDGLYTSGTVKEIIGLNESVVSIVVNVFNNPVIVFRVL